MSAKLRIVAAAGLMTCLLVGIHTTAHAFIPYGAFDEWDRLQLIRWSWASMHDENNDGDISGPDEGIEYLVEGGEYGFTDDEIDTIRDAFDVWQDVPTAAIGFQQMGVNEDPVGAGNGVDAINYVTLDAEGDPYAYGLPAGALGVTITTWSVENEDWAIDIPGVQINFPVTPWQILEADIVIGGPAHRPAAPGEEPEYELISTLVHEMGHFVGLGHTPLNNLAVIDVFGATALVEGPAVSLRDASGLLQHVGATPTMFPIVFLIDDGLGGYTDGGTTLAPDDIAGLSYMYPRGSQEGFFTISHEIRTQTRANFPSAPITAAHIVAWCDTDNDDVTPRVPLLSTLSGLYQSQPIMGGHFDLMGMLKVIEAKGSPAPFRATYTLTSNPLNDTSYERQAPNTGYDINHFFDYVESDLTPFPAAYPSEVFHEAGNEFDIAKHDVGTPLVFDRDRGTVVSVDSGKTLPTMLPMGPMFGDANDVCPLNLVAASLGGASQTPTALRRLRDDVLLKSAAGTACVDAYYRVAPGLARFLIDHPRAMAGARIATGASDWALANARTLATLVALGGIVVTALYRYRKRAATLAVLLLLAGLVCTPAQARILDLDDEEMVVLSDDIVTATVDSTTSIWVTAGGRSRIMTDVVLTVTDTVKGTLNVDSTLHLRVPGGRVGGVVTNASDMPQFAADQSVLLYLEYRQGYGHLVVAGGRGKLEVVQGAKNTQYVRGSSILAQSALAKSAATIEDAKTQDGRVSLDDYKAYLREIVKRQDKK